MVDCDAIDVHAHYGTRRDTGNRLLDGFMTGDADTVLRRAAAARTRLTFCAPLTGLLPRRGADPVAGNEEARRVVRGRAGMRYWAVVSPLHPATFAQAEESMADPWCVGLKIHPEEHGYPIREHGQQLFEFAARLRAVMITHSGEPNSLPADFVPFADAFPEATLVLAHLGFGHDGDPAHQVRAIQAARHGNVYADTSSSRGIMPRLIEWAAGEVGADRLLYGTDTPLYFAPMQRARIDHADLPEEQRRQILCGNALRLFQPRLALRPDAMAPEREESR